MEYTYDSAGRMNTQKWADASTASYGYDTAGRLGYITRSSGSGTWSYGYDKKLPATYGWARRLEDRSVSRLMEAALTAITLGDEKTWKKISSLWEEKRLDGIAAECYKTALGEIFVRCPTIFLERHLAGDKSARYLAREGYQMVYASHFASKFGFNLNTARENARRMFIQRANVSNAYTKKAVQEFIAFIESKEGN